MRVSGFGFLKLGWQGEQNLEMWNPPCGGTFLKNMVRVLCIVDHKLRLICNSATFSLGAGFLLYVDVFFSNVGFRPYIEVVIVDLLLLNMVLAILMDAYQVAWLNITVTYVVLVVPGIQGSEEQGQCDDHGATSDF